MNEKQLKLSEEIKTVHENSKYVEMRDKWQAEKAAHESLSSKSKSTIESLTNRLDGVIAELHRVSGELQEAKNQRILDGINYQQSQAGIAEHKTSLEGRLQEKIALLAAAEKNIQELSL